MPKLNESLFGRIFEGPDSLFGRVFGEDEPLAPAAAPTQPDIRIKLNQLQFDRLMDGIELKYKVDGQMIRLVAPARYSRQHIEQMLKDQRITQAEADEMLRMRAS